MTADRLYDLHERLVSDHASAFHSNGSPRSVRPTLAGQAWLNDWSEYRRIWNHLHREGLEPDDLLRSRFGCLAGADLDPEDDDDPEAA